MLIALVDLWPNFKVSVGIKFCRKLASMFSNAYDVTSRSPFIKGYFAWNRWSKLLKYFRQIYIHTYIYIYIYILIYIYIYIIYIYIIYIYYIYIYIYIYILYYIYIYIYIYIMYISKQTAADFPTVACAAPTVELPLPSQLRTDRWQRFHTFGPSPLLSATSLSTSALTTALCTALYRSPQNHI